MSKGKSGLVVERRGKFAGIKAHLDEHDCQALLDAEQALQDFTIADGHLTVPQLVMAGVTYARRLAKAIRKLQEKEPDLLLPRTPAQIEAELVEEAKKAHAKLAKAGAAISEWNDSSSPYCWLVVHPDGKVQMFYAPAKLFGEFAGVGDAIKLAAFPDVPIRFRPLVKEKE